MKVIMPVIYIFNIKSHGDTYKASHLKLFELVKKDFISLTLSGYIDMIKT